MPATLPKPKRGRPKSENPRNIVWPIRLSEAEVAEFDRKAKKAGKARGEWMRDALMASK